MAGRRRKSTKFTISLPNDQYDSLLHESEVKNRSLSKLLSDALSGRKTLSPGDEIALIEIRLDLARVGSNLNQIAHKLNMGEVVTLGKIDSTVDEVKSVIQRILGYV
ncbi:MAG: plasmid mobilization relaxosome protein MobC [Clostridia bacterium]|nr:plasmid mobilization relaxosome protein MobC [Clostridia bacterium]